MTSKGAENLNCSKVSIFLMIYCWQLFAGNKLENRQYDKLANKLCLISFFELQTLSVRARDGFNDEYYSLFQISFSESIKNFGKETY